MLQLQYNINYGQNTSFSVPMSLVYVMRSFHCRFDRDWEDSEQGQGEEFLYQAVQVKNIWIPMGDIFAN